MTEIQQTNIAVANPHKGDQRIAALYPRAKPRGFTAIRIKNNYKQCLTTDYNQSNINSQTETKGLSQKAKGFKNEYTYSNNDCKPRIS